jgi:hypothetical protein
VDAAVAVAVGEGVVSSTVGAGVFAAAGVEVVVGTVVGLDGMAVGVAAATIGREVAVAFATSVVGVGV